MLHLFATISNETCYDITFDEIPITFDEIALSFGQIRNHLTQKHLFFIKKSTKSELLIGESDVFCDGPALLGQKTGFEEGFCISANQ